MLKKLPFLLLIIFFSCKAQDKIKGSRNVKTEQYDLTAFNSIQAKGDLEIGILKGNRPMVEIEADDNLHDLIQTDVIDGILYIKPIKEISRSKRLELRVTFSDSLEKILLAGEAELTSLQDLSFGDFTLECKEKAEAYLTLTARNFNLIQNEDAKAELNITASQVNYQLNQSAEVKALVNAPVFKVDIYEKASARIEGDIKKFHLRADQSSNFDGENLTSINAELLAQGNSEVKINATDSLKIQASGNSEIEIYNNPEIELIEFKDEAILAKKEFGKGLFN